MKIAIISNDAGGAEIVSSYVLHNLKNNFFFSLSGPAIEIFQKKIPNLINETIESAIEKSTLVLTGTGWMSDNETNAIRIAKKKGIRSIAYLDHWVGYASRFRRSNCNYFPDEIWVGDAYAEAIAKNEFPDLIIKLVPNLYFSDLSSEINSSSDIKRENYNNCTNILYVASPIAEHAKVVSGDGNLWGYNEYDAISFFLDNIKFLRLQSTSICIRNHPSESYNKYYYLKDLYSSLKLQFSSNNLLLNDIINSDIVAGTNSMAMVIALIAKKRVISAIPPPNYKCSLPHKGIEIFYEIVKGIQSNFND